MSDDGYDPAKLFSSEVPCAGRAMSNVIDRSRASTPWSYVPVSIALPITVLVIFFSLPSMATYLNCQPRAGLDLPEQCATLVLLPVVDGTYSGLVGYVAALSGAAFLLVVAAALRMRRGPMWACWVAAVLAPTLAVVAFLTISGSIGTPVGRLIPI